MELDDLGGTWDKMWVWRPADSHFGAGGSSPLAFSNDGNKLTGQARLGPLVDGGEDVLGGDAAKVLAAGILVGVGGTVLAVKYVVPQVKKLRARFMGTSEVENEDEGVIVLDALRVGDFSESVGAALADLGPEMSSEEAQRRILNIMLAAASIAQNLRALDGARILEDETSHALETAIEQLSASEVTDIINRMLESDGTLLGEEDSLAFLKTFGGGQVVDGTYVPVKRAQVKKALRLTG